MNYKQVLNHLYSLKSSEIKLGLENIKNLLSKIGNPEKSLRCIHIAGTNGKCSVATMISSVLKEAGYKVGLYTSPHLKRFNERIRVNDKLITDKEIAIYYTKIKDKITNQSFFEITTAMTFLYFKDKKVDFAVLEVGLGGRLDATNVIIPLVSVITNIGLEHTRILGNSIEKIAYEKSGIIKNNIPVVTGAKGGALKVIKKIALKKKSPLIIAQKFSNIKFNYINGNFQYKNASVAVAAIKTLKKYRKIRISEKNIINGIKNVKIKGRFEFLSKNVLIDCAHNADGISTLMNELKILKRKKYEDIVFVFGALRDKNTKEMVKQINKISSKIILTKPNSERAIEPVKLLKKDKNNSKYKIINDPKDALKYAKKISKKDDLVVVCGSIYLIGEII